jgi:aminoglycoside phosphotransferase (APT) family kinase protein
MYDDLNRVLAALHNVDVEAVGLATSAAPATTSSAR